MSIYRKVYGPEHPSVAAALHNVANVDQVEGRYTQAAERYKQALSIYQNLYDREYPSLAHTLDGLANVYRALGRYTEAAEEYYKQKAEHKGASATGIASPFLAVPVMTHWRCSPLGIKV